VRPAAGPRAPVDRIRVAAALREVATLLRLEREPHRARAYERAAAVVERAPEVEQLLREGRLDSLPHIGPALAAAIRTLAAGGSLPVLERLRRRWSPGFVELMAVPGLGARKARVLQEALGIETREALAAACRAGHVRRVPGFGERSERALLEALLRPPRRRSRASILPDARRMAEPVVAALRASSAVAAAEIAGAVRRCIETVDGLDVAVATSDVRTAVETARRHGFVSDSSERGVARGVLANGFPLQLHAGPPARWGTVLARATGSAAHWDLLRARAAGRGIELDLVDAPDERSLYATLDLPWLPPEVRDGTDELADADAGRFVAPLVTGADVRGAVHCHTRYSDGKATIAEMAEAAASLGLEYVTITDHSPSASYAGGLDEDRLRRQWDEIDAVQESARVRILKGTESDILADGALDWPDAVLERLDVVIASVHRRHRQDEAQMTRRLVRAMRHPVFKIWGHALGRILLHRDPIPCRLDEVLDAAAESRAAIELNGDPYRMDLEPTLARRAAERGIRFVVSSDAHSVRGLRAVDAAVEMARRARLRPADVLNCLPSAEFAAAVRPS
jgi:DNA polymerase (family 10)